eukprot:scaffold248350_cov41-Cyclotella_meneghiniana.AAC.1
MTKIQQSSDSHLESETTDWQAPASRSLCLTPTAWPRQNEATLQLVTRTWQLAHNWHPLTANVPSASNSTFQLMK